VGEGSQFQFDINAEAMPINASLEEMNSIPTEEDCSINTPLLSLANPIDMNKFLLLK